MSQKIERDHQRFRKIVRGKVKSNLGKYISRGEMIGKNGKDLVSIPLPSIDIPQFRYGKKGSGGVGQGEGDPGQPLTAPEGEGEGGAGDQPGGHILEVDLTMEELAEILGEELALPRIEPRGKKNIVTTKDKYTGIRQTGPESLRHFKRTFKRAMKRQIASNTYDLDRPIVIPIRQDKQYRSWKEVHKPESVACIIYMMDVSGSMTDEQKEIVRIAAFWSDNWGDDIPKCVEILTEKLLPKLNLFGYGQVESPYGSGEFYDYIHELTGDHKSVIASRIPDREAILGSIKEFLGTGR